MVVSRKRYLVKLCAFHANVTGKETLIADHKWLCNKCVFEKKE